VDLLEVVGRQEEVEGRRWMFRPRIRGIRGELEPLDAILGVFLELQLS
jgi:hypothetical protein